MLEGQFRWLDCRAAGPSRSELPARYLATSVPPLSLCWRNCSPRGWRRSTLYGMATSKCQRHLMLRSTVARPGAIPLATFTAVVDTSPGGNRSGGVVEVVHAQADLLQLVRTLHPPGRPCAACTAGSKSPIKTAIIAMTTNSSINAERSPTSRPGDGTGNRS